MASLTHSPFLQALGYAIINSLWQFALLWLMYVLINAVLKLSSHQKYTAGLLLQLSGFAWFIVTFTLYFQQDLQLAEIIFPLQKSFLFHAVQSGEVTLHERYVAFVLQIEKSLPYLSAAYLVILIFSGIKWIKAYNLTNVLRTKGLHKIDVNRRIFVKQLSAQLDITREVKIYLSELVKTPLTIGFFKPVILIPLASLNHLNTDQMEAVILHELAHIRRFDYLFNLVLALIEAVLFFNPFMLLISRHIKRERENCCDDWVLQYNYNAASYSHALLQIATSQSSAHLFALKAADNKQALLHRIRRMIEKKETVFFNYRHQLIALLVVVTVLSSLAILSSRDRVNNGVISTLPQEVILQKMMFKAGEPASYPVTNLMGSEIKSNLHNKQHLQKVMKINLNTNISDEKAGKENNEIETLQTNGLRDQEINPAVLPNSNEQIEEDFKKNIETINLRAEDSPADLLLKQNQILLAEKNFQIAFEEFKKNAALYNQTVFRKEMKAALAQIKAAKTQLKLAQRLASAHKAEMNILSPNQIMNIVLPAVPDEKTMKSLMANLQLELQQAQRQYESSNSDNDCYNFTLGKIGALLNLPPIDNVHNFSFEFSKKPKVKVVTRGFTNVGKTEKRSSVFFQEDENSKQKNTSVPVPEEPRSLVIPENKVFYTIRI